jgi:hypothetical protein
MLVESLQYIKLKFKNIEKKRLEEGRVEGSYFCLVLVREGGGEVFPCCSQGSIGVVYTVHILPSTAQIVFILITGLTRGGGSGGITI